jgi:hypothetical protein
VGGGVGRRRSRRPWDVVAVSAEGGHADEQSMVHQLEESIGVEEEEEVDGAASGGDRRC